MSAADWWTERAGLDGTVAIVTGGAGGLGAAISTDLAANGVHVGLVDIDPDAVARIADLLPDAVTMVGDVREPEVLDELFTAVADRWGRLDTLVNVVGGTFRAPFADQSPRAWDALLRVNLSTVLHATTRAIEAMRAGGRGGSIVNLTTIEAFRAAPGFAVYSAAKAAVTELARTLAVELGPDGIRVNCVAPDIAPTPNMLGIAATDTVPADHPLLDDTVQQATIPMGRVGDPHDIANAVVFLASGLSSYVTGTTLHPDGGTYASSGWMNWPGTGWSNALPPHVAEWLRGSDPS